MSKTTSYYCKDKDQERIDKLKSLVDTDSTSYIIKMAIRFSLFRIKEFLKFLPTAEDEKKGDVE